MKCRSCHSLKIHDFVDLGHAPLSNAYLSESDLDKSEKYYPLKTIVCGDCWLVQTEDYLNVDEIFKSDYAYFSSTSSSWLKHAQEFSKSVINKFHIDKNSMVIEIASNDGYLLKNFVEAKIPCLGIEPTESTARVAESKGVTTKQIFFTEESALKLVQEGFMADLVIGNNVYAHVPDINDFTRGLKAILKPDGVITLEFPHFLELMINKQFDTIYHEHFSYLSLNTITKIFHSAGLTVVDVEKVPTHGGSLRIYGKHIEKNDKPSDAVMKIISEEIAYGLCNIDVYKKFQSTIFKVKYDLLQFLINQKNDNKKVVGYGAAAKGNTLLNFAGIKTDLIESVFDANVRKQGKYLPGSHIPILNPEKMLKSSFDFVIIFPWNLEKEIYSYLSSFLPYRVKILTALPRIKFL
jgi:2-polyprenyl-3-methyl-5-hydroxy-6-metoxy-1,4-benzoquinol methylase